jgi:hypothetical protein
MAAFGAGLPVRLNRPAPQPKSRLRASYEGPPWRLGVRHQRCNRAMHRPYTRCRTPPVCSPAALGGGPAAGCGSFLRTPSHWSAGELKQRRRTPTYDDAHPRFTASPPNQRRSRRRSRMCWPEDACPDERSPGLLGEGAITARPRLSPAISSTSSQPPSLCRLRLGACCRFRVQPLVFAFVSLALRHVSCTGRDALGVRHRHRSSATCGEHGFVISQTDTGLRRRPSQRRHTADPTGG